MIISVINHTDGGISDEEVHVALRAINRQIAEDFEPYWSMGAELRLEGRSQSQPDPKNAGVDMRGDAVLYLWNDTDVDAAIGYHDKNFRGIPYGFVFTEVARELGEPWTVTLSHEALEIVGDAEVNLLVKGPHPDTSQNREVFHWYEMCDAVQTETYEIDEVEVSNFVLPLYFTGGNEVGGRNDFLGRKSGGAPLSSFGINPGGYVGFFDPETGEHDTHTRGKEAERRSEIKSRLLLCRRSNRYQARTAATKAVCGLRRKQTRQRTRKKTSRKKTTRKKAAPRSTARKKKTTKKVTKRTRRGRKR